MVGRLSTLLGFCGHLFGAFAVKLQAYVASSTGYIYRHDWAIRVGFTGLVSYLAREGRYCIGPFRCLMSFHMVNCLCVVNKSFSGTFLALLTCDGVDFMDNDLILVSSSQHPAQNKNKKHYCKSKRNWPTNSQLPLWSTGFWLRDIMFFSVPRPFSISFVHLPTKGVLGQRE